MATTSNSLILPQATRSPLSAIVTAANTTYSGTTLPSGVVLLLTAGPNGSLLRRLRVRPILTSTSTALTVTQAHVLKYTGSAFAIDDDLTLAAQSGLVTTAGAPVSSDFGYTDSLNRRVTAGYSLYVGISVAYANGIAFTADVDDL